MPNEPMITIKQADGTFTQVPLSEVQARMTAAPPAADPVQDVAEDAAPPVVVSTTTEAAPVKEEGASNLPNDDIATLAELARTQVAEEAQANLQEVAAVEETSIWDDTAPETTVQETPIEAAPPEQSSTEPLPAPPDTAEDPIWDDTDTNTTPSEATEQPAVMEPPAASVSPDEPAGLPQVIGEQALAITTPNTRIFERADSCAWDDEDCQSLLEQPLTPEDVAVPYESRRPGMAATVGRIREEAPAAPLTSPSAPPKPDFSSFGGGEQQSYIPHTPKVPMQDIAPAPTVPPTPIIAPIGPVEELEHITLDDFRRLGGRKTLGIGELRQKFELLLKESILLYMQAVEAWHRSPLYTTYLSVISDSMQSGTPIDALLDSGTHDITKEEWYALVDLHREIRL